MQEPKAFHYSNQDVNTKHNSYGKRLVSVTGQKHHVEYNFEIEI